MSRSEKPELSAQAIRDTVRRVFRQGYSEDEDILLLWQAAEAHAECLDDPVAAVRRGVESGTIKGEVLPDATIRDKRGKYRSGDFIVIPMSGEEDR